MSRLCRSALSERVEIVSPPGQGTLVSWHSEGDPTEMVKRLFERGVVVRDIPGRNLIRVSCGWWTSEEDLERLLESLPDD